MRSEFMLEGLPYRVCCALVLLLFGAATANAAGHRVRLTIESEYQPGSLFVDVLTPDRACR